MIPALALSLLLSSQAAPTQAGAPAPTMAPTPVAAPAASPNDAAADPAADLEQLRQMYRDTCEAREYGAYDDMCDQLHQQVRNAERSAAQAARRRPKTGSTATPSPP